MPRFSVLVPAYNAAATLQETLDAVLAQEFGDWECVVVDDGSTDTTASTAESYCQRDSRFRLIRQQNTGAAGAYRTAVAAATSDLLAICASDDLLLPAHLRVMDELIRRDPDFAIYSCNGQFLHDESGERETVYTTSEWMAERSLSLDDVIRVCFFSVGAVFRREVYSMTGGHRVGVYVDDYDLWLRAMARGARHRYTPQILSVHRVSHFQQTADHVRVLESNIEVYENLIDGAWVSADQRPLVEAAVGSRRRMLAEYKRSRSIRRPLQGLSERLTPLLGSRVVDRIRRTGGSLLRRLRL